MFNVFSVFNNPVRVLFNGEWHDKVEGGQVVPDSENIDIQIEGHVSMEQFEQSDIHKNSGITGKALAALATKVAEGRGYTSNLSVVSDDSVYTVVAKKINGKPTLLRHSTNKRGQQVTFISLRLPKEVKDAVPCAL